MKQMMADHDVLIEVRTKVNDLRTDFKDMKDGLGVRVSALEANKLDKAEFYRLLAEELDVRKGHEGRIGAVEKSCTELTTTNKVTIRNWTLLMGAVSVLVSIALKFIN